MTDPKSKAKRNVFSEYLRVFFKHKFMILIPFILIFMGAAIFGSTLPKVYKGTAVFRMLSPSASQTRPAQRLAGNDLAVMRGTILSRSNILAVIEDVGLDASYKELKEIQRNVEEEKLVQEVRKGLDVQQKAQHLFEISYRCEDPEIAARVANAVTQRYIDGIVTGEKEIMENTITFLQRQVEVYRSKVSVSSEALARFKAEHALELPGSELSNSKELRNLRDQLAEAETNLSNAETAKGEIERQLSEIETTVVGETVVEANPRFAQYQGDIEKLELELATLKSKFTDLHPDVVKKKEQIQGLKSIVAKAQEKFTTKETVQVNPLYVALKQDLTTAQVQIASATRRKSDTLAKITEIEKRVQNAPALVKEMNRLQDEDDSNRKLLDHYTTELENSKIDQEKERDQKGTRFRVLDFANESSASAGARSKILKISFLGLILGGGLGLGLVVLKEQTDTSFKDVEDAASFLNTPVLGTIPTINTALEMAREKRKEVAGWIVVGLLAVFLGGALVVMWLTSFAGR